MVAAGEVIEGYTVASIDSDAAVMAGMGRTLQVQLNQPSATVAPPPSQARGRNTRNNNNDDEPSAAQAAQTRLQQLGGALGGNLPAAALEMMQRLQAGGGIANVQVQNGQIVVQGNDGQTVRVNPDQGSIEVRRVQDAGDQQVEGVIIRRPGGE
jgi:hypothetical protein